MLNGYCDIHHDDDDNSSPVNGLNSLLDLLSTLAPISGAYKYGPSPPSFYSYYNQQPPQQQHDNTIQKQPTVRNRSQKLLSSLQTTFILIAGKAGTFQQLTKLPPSIPSFSLHYFFTTAWKP
jgi:hypothetical protein